MQNPVYSEKKIREGIEKLNDLLQENWQNISQEALDKANDYISEAESLIDRKQWEDQV